MSQNTPETLLGHATYRQTLTLLSVCYPFPFAISPQVAEAKAAGVPVQIAVARSVTDVQQKVPLNPQVSTQDP
jgi:hypothetical protein